MKIYVCTHKVVPNKIPKNYEYIYVNAKNNKINNALTDATGDNISEKNPYYCELTAAYWIWKNDKDNEIVGLVHYRRFLTTNVLSNSIRYYLNSPKIEKNLKKYDFIATKPYKSINKVKDHLMENVSKKDYESIEFVINKYFPFYKESFDCVMNGNSSYLLNVFITTKNKWDDYYNWLFSVFDKLEPLVDMTNYSVQQQRLYGFLSERLFTVYIYAHKFTVKSYRIHIVGESKLKTARQKMARILKIKKNSLRK